MKLLAAELSNLKTVLLRGGVAMVPVGTKMKLAQEPRPRLMKKVDVQPQTICQVLHMRVFRKLNVMMDQITCLTQRGLRVK